MICLSADFPTHIEVDVFFYFSVSDNFTFLGQLKSDGPDCRVCTIDFPPDLGRVTDFCWLEKLTLNLEFMKFYIDVKSKSR